MPVPLYEILFIGALVAASVSVVCTLIGNASLEFFALATGATFGVIAVISMVATGVTYLQR